MATPMARLWHPEAPATAGGTATGESVARAKWSRGVLGFIPVENYSCQVNHPGVDVFHKEKSLAKHLPTWL